MGLKLNIKKTKLTIVRINNEDTKVVDSFYLLGSTMIGIELTLSKFKTSENTTDRHENKHMYC